MGEGRDEETAGTARGVDDFLPRPWVHHLHHHFDDVAGGEELPLRAAQRRPDENLEGFTDCVPIRFQDGVVLKLPDHIGKTVGIKANPISGFKDVAKDVLLHPFKEGVDTCSDAISGLADAGTKTYSVVRTGFLFVQQLAEEKVDDFLSKRRVPCNPDGHARQVVADVAENGFQVRRADEVLAFVQPDVFNPLPVARYVGESLIGAAAVLVVNLAQVEVVVAVEPDAYLRGGHVHVKPKLMLAVPLVAFLAFHYHQESVFSSVRPCAENGYVYRKGSILVGRSCPNSMLRMDLHLLLAVAIIFNQTAGKDLHGVDFLRRRPHLLAADEVDDELAGRIADCDAGFTFWFLRHCSIRIHRSRPSNRPAARRAPEVERVREWPRGVSDARGAATPRRSRRRDRTRAGFDIVLQVAGPRPLIGAPAGAAGATGSAWRRRSCRSGSPGRPPRRTRPGSPPGRPARRPAAAATSGAGGSW